VLKEEDFKSDLQKNISPENRIEYQMTKDQIRLNELNVKRYKVGYLPSLVAFGSYSWNAQRSDFDFFESGKPWFKTSIVGLKLNVPIFDGLNKARNIQEKKLTLLQSQNDLKQLENAISLETFNAQTTLENAIATLSNQKANMDLAEQVFNTSKIKYEQGVGSNTDIINAQTDLKQAQTEYLNALYNATVAKIDYQKATGQIK
jgi:outer membrane protein TolC